MMLGDEAGVWSGAGAAAVGGAITLTLLFVKTMFSSRDRAQQTAALAYAAQEKRAEDALEVVDAEREARQECERRCRQERTDRMATEKKYERLLSEMQKRHEAELLTRSTRHERELTTMRDRNAALDAEVQALRRR
jgi:uncharacterized membrane protein YhiD involved in acid resistance